jgi:hypothetical protein
MRTAGGLRHDSELWGALRLLLGDALGDLEERLGRYSGATWRSSVHEQTLDINYLHRRVLQDCGGGYNIKRKHLNAETIIVALFRSSRLPNG